MIASIQPAQSVQKALDGLLGFISNLIGFLIILVVGYFAEHAPSRAQAKVEGEGL